MRLGLGLREYGWVTRTKDEVYLFVSDSLYLTYMMSGGDYRPERRTGSDPWYQEDIFEMVVKHEV